MNRTENDLRAAYTDPSGIQAAERRLIESMRADGPADRTARTGPWTWAAAGASAAVVAAMVVGVTAIARDRTPAHSVGAAPAGAASSPVTDPFAAQPNPAVTQVTITAQVLLRTAIDSLPRPGTTSRYGGNFDTAAGFVGARFVYDDGHGAAQIYVSMTYPVAGTGPRGNGSIAACAAGSSGCTVLADGAHVQVRQGHQYTDGRTPNATEWALDLVRPDGVQVSVIEWNAPQPKDAALTRPQPPFTLAELTTWADSANWQVHVSAQQAREAAGMFPADDITGPTTTR